MRFIFYLTAIALTALSAPRAATASEEKAAPAAHQSTLMAKFAGTWKAEGTSFGLPSKSTMTWSRDLAGKFYRAEYRIDMDNKGKASNFTGHGYYRAGGNDGFWADTSGDLHPLVISYTENGLTAIWGKAGGKQGRSSYIMQADGRIEVIDWILRDEGWREFNRTLFSRAN